MNTQLKQAMRVISNHLKNDDAFYKYYENKIARVIIKEWSDSKLGVYMEKNEPQWIKDIFIEKHTAIDYIAKKSTNEFLQSLIKNYET